MRDKFAQRIDSLDESVLKQLSQGKKAVFEFGTFTGGSALSMLPQIKEAGGHLWCFDNFRDNVDDPIHRRILPGEVLSKLMERIEPYHQLVTIIIGDIEQARNFPKGIADLVFIDAAHGYSMVKRDIEIAMHLCQPDGIVSGHDYTQHYEACDVKLLEQFSDVGNGFYNGIGYGVIKVVHEAFGTPNNKGGIWWVNLES